MNWIIFFSAEPGIIFPSGNAAYPQYDLWTPYLNSTGAVDHKDGHGYVLTAAQFAALKPLQLQLGCCKNVTLVPDAQIKPRKTATDPIQLVIKVFLPPSHAISKTWFLIVWNLCDKYQPSDPRTSGVGWFTLCVIILSIRLSYHNIYNCPVEMPFSSVITLRSMYAY